MNHVAVELVARRVTPPLACCHINDMLQKKHQLITQLGKSSVPGLCSGRVSRTMKTQVDPMFREVSVDGPEPSVTMSVEDIQTTADARRPHGAAELRKKQLEAVTRSGGHAIASK
jgi:hypothetical protein